MTPPSSAAAEPKTISAVRTGAAGTACAKLVRYVRATAYTPSSTITPENSMQTGVGATACASASQKWKGTAAAFTRKPVQMRTKETVTSAS